eukprot:gene1251-1415_t
MASDGADDDYYRELQLMGYENEVVRDQVTNRGREYHGMLHVGCKRVVQNVPVLVRGISNLNVVSVAAGYAHCMLLTSNGRLYSCGYNDRGQLGLNHRISTAEFKPVTVGHDQHFVVQVVCGQQHTMCRVVDRNHVTGVQPGSPIGANVYVWGSGMLGQLGLGRKGTTGGCLKPAVQAHLLESFPLGIRDISAGENFSVAVTVD